MSEKQPKEVQITTKIKSLKLIEFSIEPLSDENRSHIDSTKFGFENKVNMRIEPALKNLFLQYTLDIFMDETKSQKLGEISAIGEFDLINLDDFRKDELLKLPNELLAMYIGIMIATVRGMLVVKAQGTHLEEAYVPILNPMEFFNKNSH
jgi:hypothetical protein